MVNELSYAYLHQVLRYNNKEKPYDDNIGPMMIPPTHTYPAQYEGLVGTTQDMSYLDYNITKMSEIRRGIKNVARPEDDTPVLLPMLIGPEKYDYREYDVQVASVKVLRADKEDPHVFIGVTTDYKAILVGKVYWENSRYTFEPKINSFSYPTQYKELIGTECSIEFPESINDRVRTEERNYSAYILRADNVEPGRAVIMDKMASFNNKCRFFLESEAWFRLKSNNHILETRKIDVFDEDYNNYKTGSPDYNNITDTRNWAEDKFSNTEEISDDTIITIRKNLLENIEIFI